MLLPRGGRWHGQRLLLPRGSRGWRWLSSFQLQTCGNFTQVFIEQLSVHCYSGFPKETPELNFWLRFFFRSATVCITRYPLSLNTHARRFDSNMPFLVLPVYSRIICGPHRGSFAVQFGDYLSSGIICGAVQIFIFLQTRTYQF